MQNLGNSGIPKILVSYVVSLTERRNYTCELWQHRLLLSTLKDQKLNNKVESCECAAVLSFSLYLYKKYAIEHLAHTEITINASIKKPNQSFPCTVTILSNVVEASTIPVAVG